MEQEIEYSLLDLIEILLKRIWLIVLCVLIGTTGSFLVTKFVIEDEYTTAVSMYVAPNKDSSTNVIASLNELNYAQKVVDTYIEILKTNSFMRSVSEVSDLGYSAGEIKSMIEISAINNTELFEIKVTTNNPEESLALANTISGLAPTKIIQIKDADAVRVVDPATLPQTPSAPNLLLNTGIGFVLALMIGVMLAFVLEMLDKRVKDEDDLLKRYDIPVLGIVPHMEDK